MSNELVITDTQDALVFGPASWRAIQQYVGLRGNRAAPPRPYTWRGLTLRDVVYDDKNEFQDYDAGSVDGDVYRYRAVWKSLQELKTIAIGVIHTLYNTANTTADQNMARGLELEYQAALSANWDRRKELLDAIELAGTRQALAAVWSTRTDGWTIS